MLMLFVGFVAYGVSVVLPAAIVTIVVVLLQMVKGLRLPVKVLQFVCRIFLACFHRVWGASRIQASRPNPETYRASTWRDLMINS